MKVHSNNGKTALYCRVFARLMSVCCDSFTWRREAFKRTGHTRDRTLRRHDEAERQHDARRLAAKLNRASAHRDVFSCDSRSEFGMETASEAAATVTATGTLMEMETDVDFASAPRCASAPSPVPASVSALLSSTSLADMTVGRLAAAATVLSNEAASNTDVVAVLERLHAWWLVVKEVMSAATAASWSPHDDPDSTDDTFVCAAYNGMGDVQHIRTGTVDADTHSAFLAVVNSDVVQLLPRAARDAACTLAALRLLYSVVSDVSLPSPMLVPYLVCIINGIQTSSVAVVAVCEAVRCLTAVMSTATSWVDEDVVHALVLAMRAGRAHGQTYILVLTHALAEALRACSTARLAVVLPVLFDIVQASDAPVTCRAEALRALVQLSPMDEPAFKMLRSSGVLAYCVRGIVETAPPPHDLLLQRMLQFVGTFTDEHFTTTQWALEAGLLDVLGHLAEVPDRLAPPVVKEVLWIIADLACSSASVRALLFSQTVLVGMPAVLLCTPGITRDTRVAAATVLTIVMENADARVVELMMALHAVQALTCALRDGVPEAAASNVLMTLEDMFHLDARTLTEFVAHGGPEVLASMTRTASDSAYRNFKDNDCNGDNSDGDGDSCRVYLVQQVLRIVEAYALAE